MNMPSINGSLEGYFDTKCEVTSKGVRNHYTLTGSRLPLSSLVDSSAPAACNTEK